MLVSLYAFSATENISHPQWMIDVPPYPPGVAPQNKASPFFKQLRYYLEHVVHLPHKWHEFQLRQLDYGLADQNCRLVLSQQGTWKQDWAQYHHFGMVCQTKTMSSLFSTLR